MIKRIKSSRLARMIGALVLLSGLFATNAMAAAPGTVTMTVTAVGKKDTSPPVVTKDDVQLYLNKERTQIADWKHGGRLYLAVLIDDSLDSGIANQWNDLKAFFAAQPDTTYISVAYARNGSAMLAQDFTSDHELAANSGIDYFRGDFWTRPPDLDSTISRAQKQNINVWTIYAPDAGHRGRGFFIANRAQSYLTELSDQTGAESFYLGTAAPVTLKPYFDELSVHFSNQYLLTFKASGGAKGRFERVRIATELPYVEFLAASQAFLPPVK